MDLTNNLINSNTITSSAAAATTTTTTNPPKRIRIESDDWIDKAPRSKILEYWKEQDLYIDYLELRLNQLQQSIESNEHLREKEIECKKLKSMLNYRFLTKTTQQQTLDQMRDIMQTPSLTRLRQTYLDPSVNLIYGQMREEIDQCRKVRDEAQNELQAWKFTPDSKTGKMLMARCKKLLEENEQLGKIVSSDNVAKLEGEIALQNRLLSTIKDSQKDYEEIMLDMDTNMDGMSSTLLHMRQQLINSHREITSLNEENARLKTLCQFVNNSSNTLNGTTHTDSSSTVSTTTTNTNTKLPQKRPHPSNRTTQNVITAEKLKPTTNLYDVDETISPSLQSQPPVSSSSHEMMDTDSNTLTSTPMNSTNNNNNINNNNNNNNQHVKRTSPLENGINVTP